MRVSFDIETVLPEARNSFQRDVSSVYPVTAAGEVMHDIPGSDWQTKLDELTKDQHRESVILQLVSQEFGDRYEGKQMPFAYLECDRRTTPSLGVGGRDSRIPVVLRYTIEHPKRLRVDPLSAEPRLAVEVVGADDTRTLMTIRRMSRRQPEQSQR